MKSSAVVLGMVFALAAGSAHAAVIYNTIDGHAPAGSLVYNYGPIAQSFYTSQAVTLTSVSLELSATSQIGMTSIYLVANVGGSTGVPGTPAYTGSGPTFAFTSPILLGQISNSALTGSAAPATVSFTQTIASGEYWIAAVTSEGSSTSWWYSNSDTGAVGLANQLGMDQIPGDPEFFSSSAVIGEGYGGYEMTVNATPAAVPEPASLAILGVALAGFGLIRRRKSV